MANEKITNGKGLLPSMIGLIPRNGGNGITLDEFLPYDRYDEVIRPRTLLPGDVSTYDAPLPHFASIGVRISRSSDSHARAAVIDRIDSDYAVALSGLPLSQSMYVDLMNYYEWCVHQVIILCDMVRFYRIHFNKSTSDTKSAYGIYRTLSNGLQFRTRLARSCNPNLFGDPAKAELGTPTVNDTPEWRQPISNAQYNSMWKSQAANFKTAIQEWATELSKLIVLDAGVLDRILALTQFGYKDSDDYEAPVYFFALDHSAYINRSHLNETQSGSGVYEWDNTGVLHHYCTSYYNTIDHYTELMTLMENSADSYARVRDMLRRVYGGRVPSNSPHGNEKLIDTIMSVIDTSIDFVYDPFTLMMLKNATVLPSTISDGDEQHLTLEGMLTTLYFDDDEYAYEEVDLPYILRESGSYNGVPAFAGKYLYVAGFDLDRRGYAAVKDGTAYRSMNCPVSLKSNLSSPFLNAQLLRWKGNITVAPRSGVTCGVSAQVGTESIMSFSTSVFDVSTNDWKDVPISTQFVAQGTDQVAIANTSYSLSMLSWLGSLPISAGIIGVGDFTTTQNFWPLTINNLSVDQLTSVSSVTIGTNIYNQVGSAYRYTIEAKSSTTKPESGFMKTDLTNAKAGHSGRNRTGNKTESRNGVARQANDPDESNSPSDGERK